MAPQIQEAGGRMMFSVIIPAYNRRVLLEQALTSVWAQEFKDYEVIVVDDGSTDGTMKMLEAQQCEHTALKVIRQANAGPGAARNRGAREAAGEYLAFLDSDDLWLPWTLGTFAEVVIRQEHPAVVGGNFVECDPASQLESIDKGLLHVMSFDDFFESWKHPFYVGAGMGIIRRDYFLQSGGFLEDRLNAEDHDLMMCLGACPGYVKILSPVTLAYRRHECSETADFKRVLSGTLRLIKRERQGDYAGGMTRAGQRQRILAAQIRPVAIGCLTCGLIGSGWDLYVQSFRWQIHAVRVRFLVGFPMLALVGWAGGLYRRLTGRR